MMVLTYNSDKKSPFYTMGRPPSWTPWPVRNLHPVRDWIQQFEVNNC